MRSKGRAAAVDEGAALLEEACARNAPVELQYQAANGELMTARTRVLGLDAEHVYLDRPHSIGQDVRFRPREKVEGYMLLNEVRYAFKSAVVDLQRIVEINDRKCAVGMVIRRPRTVREGQRRSHFRVRVLGNDPIELDLHAALADESGACPVDAKCLRAALVDLSVGGAGLHLSGEDARGLEVGDLLFMTFRLPEEPGEFYFLVQVRQLWALRDDTGRRVGVKIKPWPCRRELELTQQRLQRYITSIQRARLRRAG